MKRLVLRILILGLAFIIVTQLVPGIELSGSWLSAFWAGIVFIILNLLVRPLVWLVKLIAFPITLLTLGLMSLLISFGFNILIFWVMSSQGWGIKITKDSALLWAPLALSIVTAILNLIFRPDRRDERDYRE